MSKDSNWLYTEKLKEHFMTPKNILMDPTGYEADGVGDVGNVKCGDEMQMYIKVDKEKGVITDCKWKTFGCASAIASTSILSEMVKGMTLEDAYRVSPKDITKQLGGLPENKIHCSVLGDKALRAAIDDYYKKNGMESKIKTEAAKIVCECLNITDHEIEEAVLEGARTFFELQEATKISTACGKCKDSAEKLLNEYVKKHFDK